MDGGMETSRPTERQEGLQAVSLDFRCTFHSGYVSILFDFGEERFD